MTGTLTVLPSPAPFTYIETYSSINSDCATSPVIMTEWRTAYIGDAVYPGLGEVFTISSGTFYVTYTFPGLFLTDLTPGEVMTQVRSVFMVLQSLFALHEPSLIALQYRKLILELDLYNNTNHC